MGEKWAEETVKGIATELAHEDSVRIDKGLSVPGLETFLIGLATKVLVAVLTSAATAAAKKGAVELLKAVKTPKDLNALEAELVSLKGILRKDGVATAARLRLIEEQLIAEGVPAEEAAPMAAKIAALIGRELGGTGAPS